MRREREEIEKRWSDEIAYSRFSFSLSLSLSLALLLNADSLASSSEPLTPGQDNDSLSALVGTEMGVDLVILLSDVEGSFSFLSLSLSLSLSLGVCVCVCVVCVCCVCVCDFSSSYRSLCRCIPPSLPPPAARVS